MDQSLLDGGFALFKALAVNRQPSGGSGPRQPSPEAHLPWAESAAIVTVTGETWRHLTLVLFA